MFRIKSIIIPFLVFIFLSGGSLSRAEGKVTVQWFGHAFFLITSSQGTAITLDPFGDIGYPLPEVKADAVTISHEHPDHNNAALIKGKPTIIRGLKEGGKEWNKIDKKVKEIRIYSLPSYHDAVKGAKRGKNTIFILEIEGIRLAHLGDLGDLLSEKEIKEMGKIDLLLIPVGGYYTIDGKVANRLVEQIHPQLTIPMHYKTEVTSNLPISEEKDFLQGKDNVLFLNKKILTVEKRLLSGPSQIVVMGYK